MTEIPTVNWKDIAVDDTIEPKNLSGLFDFLFLSKKDEQLPHNDLNFENTKSIQFFANKLTSIPRKERSEKFYDLLSYSLYVATFFTLKKEYEQAMHVFKWLDLEKALIKVKDSNVKDTTALYGSVLYYFIKNELDDLTEEDIGCFNFFTFGNLAENVHFDIAWKIFSDLWDASMPTADFFGWSFKVLENNVERMAERIDLPIEDVLESYLDGLIDIYSIGLRINGSELLDHTLEGIYIKLDNPFLKRSVDLFKNDITNKGIKEYIKAIRKDLLELHEPLLKKYINKIYMFFIHENKDLFTFLQEVSKKKYLISLLEFTYEKEVFVAANDILKKLVHLENKEAFHLALSIYEWLEPDVQNEIIEKEPFYLAYLHSQVGERLYAVDLYKSLLDMEPENLSVINNLAVLYYEYLKNYNEALSLLKKGERLAPEHELIQKNIKTVSDLIEQERKRPEIIKDRYFKKINKLQRSILFTIYKLSGEEQVTNDLIQSVTKLTDYNFYKKNLKTLMDLELVSHDTDMGYILDITVYELIKDYVNPTIDREVVKASQNTFYRPIFFHESEIRLYQALIELFPQQLVFPNMDLKAIIDVDKVKPYLDPDVVDYMFKAHVDFAIINNTNYLPILCIEKDSSYQDDSYGANNALKKNMIFSTSGLPLIRIRYTSAMDSDRLREEVKQATKQFLLQTYKEDDTRDVLKEFDLKRFGIYFDLPTEDDLKTTWREIVGDMILNETKDIKLEKNNAILYIYISNSAEQVLKYGKEGMKAGLYQQYPTLNAIEFIFV